MKSVLSSIGMLVIAVTAGAQSAAAQNAGGGTATPAPSATSPAAAPQAAPAPRPVPPTRDPGTPGYVPAKELPDGTVPAANADGNFIIGPTHNPAPEMTVLETVPHGTIYNLTM